MTRFRALPLAITGVVACVVALGWQESKQPAKSDASEDYVIRTTSRLVLLDVSVRDPQGGLITGLTKDNFKIYENGKQQTISQFANADIPVAVGLVVDESGSMRPKRPEVITAALAFIQASNPQDEIFVVNFNERARRGLPDMVPFSDNITDLRAALWRGTPEGRTALYDAIELSLHQLELARRDKKTLVVISDGGDNVSTHGLKDVMQDVLQSLATIYTVGIFDDEDPEKNPAVLEKLAHVSGGGVYFPKELDKVVSICQQIAKDVRTRYTIGYIPEAEGKPERHIKVVASSPDGGKLNVRTRSSYMLPQGGPVAAAKASQ
jgi:Ca-activated chloride channel homolog